MVFASTIYYGPRVTEMQSLLTVGPTAEGIDGSRKPTNGPSIQA